MQKRFLQCRYGGKGAIALLWCLLIMVIGACSTDDTLVLVPTLPVTPLPPTNTPLPPTETPTLEPRLSPLDLLTATPVDVSIQMSHLAQADALTRIRASERIEDIVSVPMRWEDTPTLGCGISATTTIRRTDGFWVLITAGGRVYSYRTDQSQTLVLCDIYAINDMPVAVRLLTDPLVGGLVALAQRRLANQYDILERRVQVIDIVPYIWQDSSLGCPDPRQTYTPQTIAGYRLVLQVGEALYAFHTDSEQIRPCPDGREVLPIDMPEATPQVEVTSDVP